ncbi:ComEC/Rec2 family competence protein [Mesoterricola silvestris]|uniref:Metallo-beta-lactamase domain-containing protein n=1 Tax=Mesoterricola silvestris TaxID=2927979 RepID=A0AA48GMQ9_9BACT|nr:hypothetical protein [Mesoterricola silvestris]BDU72704.1 hypothetical protein METEAL_18780 [Mesoterricola silvestris]
MTAAHGSGTKGGKDVTIRMYRHGLGDCFLLGLPRAQGGGFHVLIDCGLISGVAGARETMREVVGSIREACGDHLDLAVITHAHWDHVSAFSREQAQDLFEDGMAIDEVWYAWTEDPTDKLGQKLRRERGAKLAALAKASPALAKLGEAGSARMLERRARVDNLLQFYGLEGAASLGAASADAGRTAAAFEYLARRHGVRTRYLAPGDPPRALPGVEGVRVYAVGPPRNEALLKRSDPTRKGREVYEFVSDEAQGECLGAAFDRVTGPTADDSDCPFEASFCRGPGRRAPSAQLARLIQEVYDAKDMAWRRVDDDWTAAAETLALNLDSHTNNTSLVLAFELTGSGGVLLFAADAQVGNWLSWQDVTWEVPEAGGTRSRVTGADLLRRTVFYKVGHHGSHNATLRELGLEQMASEDLVAAVPVSVAQAKAKRWTQMPFKPLMERLAQKTGGRVLVSDVQAAAPTLRTLGALNKAQRAGFLKALKEEPLYYELSIPLA